mgnify:FL=1
MQWSTRDWPATKPLTLGEKMNDATLQAFRKIADEMIGGAAANWQWIGKHMSQRMFGITEERAKDYAKRFGGEAKQMK